MQTSHAAFQNVAVQCRSHNTFQSNKDQTINLRFTLAVATVDTKLLSVWIRFGTAKVCGLVLAKFAPKYFGTFHCHAATGTAVAKVFDRSIGLVGLDAGAAVVTVVAATFVAAVFAQEARKSRRALAVL